MMKPAVARILVVVAAAGVAISGCRGDGTREVSLFDDERIPFWSVTEVDWSIGGSDEREEYILFDVHGAAFLSDGVVIADGGYRIRFYDSTGVFQWRAGGRGQGPGEFVRIGGLSTIGDSTVIVWDLGLQRLTTLTDLGHVIQTSAPDLGATINPYPTFMGALEGGRLVFCDDVPLSALQNEPLGDRRDSIRFIVTEDLSGGVRAALTVRGSEAYLWKHEHEAVNVGGWGTLSPIFGRSTFGTVGSNGLIVGFNDSLEIRRFDEDGTLEIEATYPPWADAVSRSDIAAERARLLEERPGRGGVPAVILQGMSLSELSRPGVENAIEMLTHRSTRPAFSVMHSDMLGRVWVAEHADPGSSGFRRWLVLDDAFSPLARVDIPADIEVLAIGRDRIAVLRTDELGIQTILAMIIETG